jgi:uracil-DNA glycosylase
MEKVNPHMEPGWLKLLGNEFQKDYFSRLKQFLVEEKLKYRVYPPGSRIFAAFDYTPFDQVKVVILGQDPYHGVGQANGLCFSVANGVQQPPSLVNIFKELHDDLGFAVPQHGNLEKWAQQGVLLLNATLTVRANSAGSHQDKGWEYFTDHVISVLSEQKEGLVFILWGNFAIAKRSLIDESKHTVISSAHPSPFSVYRGFFGSRPFSKTNLILRKQGQEPIDWEIN